MKQSSASLKSENTPGFSAENFALSQSSRQTSSVGGADQRLACATEALDALTRLVQVGKFPPFVITSRTMLELISDIYLARNGQAPLFITGETGTGKELLALAAHASSARRSRELLALNCATYGRELMESQLFGHRRGSFTGAFTDVKGIIREADGGTLFLDEVCELGLDLQPKLLRFLQEGEVHPVGAPRPIKTDVRVIAATNRDPEEEVRAGRFRADLFERLDVMRLHIPPLRERREEIPPLIEHFMDRYQRENHKRGLRPSDEAAKLMTGYDWPHNVRQLANEVCRLVMLSRDSDLIGADLLSTKIRAAEDSTPVSAAALVEGKIVIDASLSYHEAKDQMQRQLIIHALHEAGGNLQQAAARLQMDRGGLKGAIKRLGIEVERNKGIAVRKLRE